MKLEYNLLWLIVSKLRNSFQNFSSGFALIGYSCLKSIFAIALIFTFSSTYLFSQRNVYDDYRQLSFERTEPNYFSHFSFSSNLLDWALVIPNVGVECDLGNPRFKKTPSIYLQFKGSPQGRNYLKDGIFNQTCYTFWNTHAEIRFHFNFHSIKESTQGRFYAGLYGEYMDFTLRTPLDVIDRNKLKDGHGVIVGFSFGYDRPLFSYSNNHFIELQFGGNVGLCSSTYDAYEQNSDNPEIYSPVSKQSNFPMVTELRVALTYRNYSIKRKYYDYDRDAYDRIVTRDYDEIKRAEKLSESLYADIPVIYKKTRNGNDSILVHKISINTVREALKDYVDEYGLDMRKVVANPENTSFPISTVGDHYQVIYRVMVHSSVRGGAAVEFKYALPFRVVSIYGNVVPTLETSTEEFQP